MDCSKIKQDLENIEECLQGFKAAIEVSAGEEIKVNKMAMIDFVNRIIHRILCVISCGLSEDGKEEPF